MRLRKMWVEPVSRSGVCAGVCHGVSRVWRVLQTWLPVVCVWDVSGVGWGGALFLMCGEDGAACFRSSLQ